MWLASETREEWPDKAHWDWVIDIIQTEFRGGRTPYEFTCQMIVIILKGNGELRGVKLVKVIWNALSGVISWLIRAAVNFHDILHGFRDGQGTGTYPLEAKMIQKLTSMR